MRYAYPAEITEAPDGVTVTFPDVPEAITAGATREEALERAADALVSALSFHVEDGRPLPRRVARFGVLARDAGSRERRAISSCSRGAGRISLERISKSQRSLDKTASFAMVREREFLVPASRSGRHGSRAARSEPRGSSAS